LLDDFAISGLFDKPGSRVLGDGRPDAVAADVHRQAEIRQCAFDDLAVSMIAASSGTAVCSSGAGQSGSFGSHGMGATRWQFFWSCLFAFIFYFNGIFLGAARSPVSRWISCSARLPGRSPQPVKPVP
jgi:hypothetical protein